MHLLFLCAPWHGLAKLRQHSDLTLDVLDDVTTALGKAFRHFQQEICPVYNTRELKREVDARRRRQSKKTIGSAERDVSGMRSDQVKKEFNIQTYKYHALGDYVKTIRTLGTTDSYSSTVVSALVDPVARFTHRHVQGELEHRTPKRRYLRTNRKSFVKQLTQIERRQTRIRRIKEKIHSQTGVHSEDASTTPDVHYHIGLSENHFEHLGTFLRAHSGDPAVKVQ